MSKIVSAVNFYELEGIKRELDTINDEFVSGKISLIEALRLLQLKNSRGYKDFLIEYSNMKANGEFSESLKQYICRFQKRYDLFIDTIKILRYYSKTNSFWEKQGYKQNVEPSFCECGKILITDFTTENKEPAPQLAAQGAAVVLILTDAECIQRLVDTGFIIQNPSLKDMVKYIVKKGHTVLNVFEKTINSRQVKDFSVQKQY